MASGDALQEARESWAAGMCVLDFSSVRRIDPSVLRGMEELAGLADEKAITVVLRGVNIDIYKVLAGAGGPSIGRHGDLRSG